MIQIRLFPESNVSQQLLREYAKLAVDKPETTLWLAPTARAAQEVRQRLFAVVEEPIRHPNIYSFDEFTERLILHHRPDDSVLSPFYRRMLINDLIETSVNKGELAFFKRIADTRGFAEAVGGMFTELKQLGIGPEQFQQAIESLHRRLNQSKTEAKKHKLTQAARLYIQYQKLLDKEQVFDEDDRYLRAIDLLSQNHREPFAKIETIFVVGVRKLTRMTQRLLTKWSEGQNSIIEAPIPCDDSPQNRASKTLPSGLATVREKLFQPMGNISSESMADGIRLIEAPGATGEARLIARELRQLFETGVSPDQVILTARRLDQWIDILTEVFEEYGIPFLLEGEEPLARCPPVATLLRTLRLPEEDWPFPQVTALLRSTLFRPEWPEAGNDPNISTQSEMLLRFLGEPRHRSSYLRAIETWAVTPPPGLEDEQAEEGLRRKKHLLAQRCFAFLARFFSMMDAFPEEGTIRQFSQHAQTLADDIGLSFTASEYPRDAAGLDCLWATLARFRSKKRLTRSQFLKLLETLSLTTGLPRSATGPERVRVLPVEEACHLSCDYLFIIGLGEGTFPDLAPPLSILDDADRQLLTESGLTFAPPEERLSEEMILFKQLVSIPRCGLTLSYAAVDSRGHPLLPSTFLSAVKDCFSHGKIPTRTQRMLLEGYFTQEPLAAAERRVRFAIDLRENRNTTLNDIVDHADSPDMYANLLEAKKLIHARFHDKAFNRYDGWLEHPPVLRDLLEKFGPERVFSPTALEVYVSCPFRFMLEHLLRFQPLPEPDEGIEHTRRGAVFHRALSRFHTQLRASGAKILRDLTTSEAVGEDLLTELDTAVKEYVDRAPSPAAKVLWELEGQRLRRFAVRYRDHWKKFLEPWWKLEVTPTPDRFEADFGFSETPQTTGQLLPALVIKRGDIEVQIGGRIDRIDISTIVDGLGFWIIDYKTGQATHYTSADLQTMTRLQLPLYALAVQKLFFGEQKSRPLGLAYWLVTDSGPKSVLPSGKQAQSWLEQPEHWEQFKVQLEEWVTTIAHNIRRGAFPLAPKSVNCTDTCRYGEVCRISQSRHTGKIWVPQSDN